MKIISWNVNGIRACANKGFFEFLQKEDPDILCIQESKVHPDVLDKQKFITPLNRLSYWSFADTKGYSGTVTFVKKPAQKVQHGIGIKKFDNEGRFVITEHKNFLLFNIYFPNGSQRESRHLFKQEFLKRLSSYLQKIINTKKQIIVVGDYNTAYLEQDVFNPKGLKNHSGFLPQERQWFQEFLSIGFTDCYRHLYPHQRNAYTWWSYREGARKNNKGWRIDHICMTSPLINSLKSVKILSQQHGSDHCPIEIQL